MSAKATVFLKLPAGVAIRTDDIPTTKAATDALGWEVLVLTNDRGQQVIIPTDNIASIEINP